MDRIFEQHYTGNALASGATTAFWALSFPPEASIEKVVVAETTTNTASGGPTFTVDVFNSSAAEGKDPKIQSLYKVVPSQSGNNDVMELFLASGGAYHNIVGTEVTPERKIYVQLKVTTAVNPAAASDFTIAIAGVIPN